MPRRTYARMPPLLDGSSTQPSFQCRYPGCSMTYQRKEHLNRHMANHEQGERFSCPYCDSILARSDLLRRHIRNYHPEREPPQSRARQACGACHARKERCDGGYPCNRCQQRRVTCPRPQGATHGKSKSQETQTRLNPDIVNSVPGESRWIAQDFIDIYFHDFHPTWPFLHWGTFELSKEPCILLQSMLMIGLWIKGDQAARDTAMTFHSKLLSAIEAQRSQWYISDSTQRRNNDTPWPMATYQSILLQLIFAVLVTKQETTFDLNLRFQLQDPKYELLTSLVETCRRLGLFHYPNMLAKYHSSAPIALVWVNVEEIKRFGLALYKICRLCTRSASAGTIDRDSSDKRSELLTLADLDFCMPDSDEMWNAPLSIGAESIRSAVFHQACRDNRDPDNWISQTSGKLCDSRVSIDWI
ncbi:C6 and C2H2 transcription factor [Aspergillus parasiticus]|uniref:C6 and C2H2 transcription factor n=1 Tax=Aspergillus parasiticus TaxID=5067 RepID=A0A5N6DCT8_ASPPA|nr:C6 and C2H2 transcription factor [Aspergillus parasiticus]